MFDGSAVLWFFVLAATIGLAHGMLAAAWYLFGPDGPPETAWQRNEAWIDVGSVSLWLVALYLFLFRPNAIAMVLDAVQFAIAVVTGS